MKWGAIKTSNAVTVFVTLPAKGKVTYFSLPAADPGFPKGGGRQIPRVWGANIRFCQISPKTA